MNLKVADVIDHARRDDRELRECGASKGVRSHPVPVALVGECFTKPLRVSGFPNTLPVALRQVSNEKAR